MEQFDVIMSVVSQGGIGLLLVYILYFSWRETKKEFREDLKDTLTIIEEHTKTIKDLSTKIDFLLSKTEKCPCKDFDVILKALKKKNQL